MDRSIVVVKAGEHVILALDRLDRVGDGQAEKKVQRKLAITEGIVTSAGQKDFIEDALLELLAKIAILETTEWDAREAYRNVEDRAKELQGVAATLRTEMKLASHS